MPTSHPRVSANDSQGQQDSVPAHPSQGPPQVQANTIHSDQNVSRSTPMSAPVVEQAPETMYKGYKFFKADPMPNKTATWYRVERTQMHLKHSHFYKMVAKRASRISAARQYQNLSEIRRAHVDLLLHDQRDSNPNVEWSCVYAKEHDKPAKARNDHPNDYETVSMDIILMRRPRVTSRYRGLLWAIWWILGFHSI